MLEISPGNIKYSETQDRNPTLVSSLRALMTTELGSMALPTRRSSRTGRGSNGRDVQLDRLGNVLTAPTRQAKKRFAPSDGLSLPDNVLAPVPKKRRRNKKVFYTLSILTMMLTNQKATLPPPAPLQPCHQPLVNIDPRLGFLTPHHPPTPLSPILHHGVPPQLLAESQHTTYYPSPQPLAATPSIHHPSVPTTPLMPPATVSRPSPDLGDSESEGSDTDHAQTHEPDIDERSDDEDDRAARTLLRSTPTVMQDVIDPLTILPYNHQGFAVSW